MADRQQGFSLIETLVALALLGLVTGVVYSSYSTSMSGAEESARAALATRFAKSKLEAISASGLLAAGEQQGATEDGFRWRVTVNPIAHQDSALVDTAAVPGRRLRAVVPRAALVTVTVSWQGRHDADRAVELTTVRLAGPGEDG